MMRHSSMRLVGVLVLAVGALGCLGAPVEVPPAYVGKLNTESGLQEGVIPPSKFRLEKFCVNCDNLILIETSDKPVKEAMKLFMPKDELNLNLEVRGTFSISPDEQNVNMICSRITSKQSAFNRISYIELEAVYRTYAMQGVRDVVRATLAEYTIMEVMENRGSVGLELFSEVKKRLAKTPIKVIQFGLADLQPPDVIVQAKELAKKREVEIQQAEAEKQIQLAKAEARYAVAVQEQKVDLKEAETQVMVQRKLAEGVSKAWLQQRMAKAFETLAKSNNKVVIITEDALANPVTLLGALNEGQR